MQLHIYVCVYKNLMLLHFGEQQFSCHQGSVEINSFVLIIIEVNSIFVEVHYIITVPLSDM